jgi:hypothetical protein
MVTTRLCECDSQLVMGGMVGTARVARSSGFDRHQIEVAVRLDMGAPALSRLTPAR